MSDVLPSKYLNCGFLSFFCVCERLSITVYLNSLNHLSTVIISQIQIQSLALAEPKSGFPPFFRSLPRLISESMIVVVLQSRVEKAMFGT